MSPVTLWRWLQKPEFAETLRKARRETFSQSLARLQHAANAAVNTLLRVMTDREAPAASRVRAADVVLQATVRGMEVEDIEVRVAELERAAEAQNSGAPGSDRKRR
jgi:GTP cyclohydrolase FolE2